MSTRRGHGVEWCKAGAHYVTESKMHAMEGRDWVKLETCRDCQHGRIGTRTRSIQAELAGRS